MVDQQDRGRDRHDGNRGDAQNEAVVAGMNGADQKRTHAGIAEDLLRDDGAVEDGSKIQGEARHLGPQSVSHHVGSQDSSAIDAGQFSIDDVILGHDIRDQGPHSHEPSTDTDGHQGQNRQDRVHSTSRAKSTRLDRSDAMVAPPLIGSTGHRNPKMISRTNATM